MIEAKVLEERMKNLIETNKKEHTEIKVTITRQGKDIMERLSAITHKLDTLDEDFPTRVELSAAKERIKNIENVLKGAGGMVMVAILGSLLKLVLK